MSSLSADKRWNRTTEIDISCSDRSGNVLSGECKYRKKKADATDLRKHTSKDISDILNPEKGKVHYWYFSFSGFTEDALRKADCDDITPVTGEDVFSDVNS